MMWHCFRLSFIFHGVPFLLLLVSSASKAEPITGWDSVPGILKHITRPTFPDVDFPVTAYGGESGEESDSRPAILAAIEDCHKKGGGRVVLPKGVWLSKGPIHLKSNVNLHLAQDATLKFSANPDDYLPVVFTRYEGTELLNYSPPIYAYDQENIALTGAGTIDGQASDESWWAWKRSKGDAVERLGKMAEQGTPPEERVFGKGHQIRPNFVQPYRCKNVLIEGVTVLRSPMWEINPVLCENVTVRKLRITTHGPNNDGCNPECCKNVLIEDCYFDTGDDCIAIKSGRNADGRRVGVPSENIVIRNCTMKDGHGGVVLGSEMSGGIRNVFVENCRMDSPNLERAIRLKSNSMRGGYLENLFVRDITVGEVSDAVVRINLRYWHPESGSHFPKVRNIFIERVTSTKSDRPLHLVGLPGHAIENVHLSDCEFRGAKHPSIIEHVDKLILENVSQPEK